MRMWGEECGYFSAHHPLPQRLRSRRVQPPTNTPRRSNRAASLAEQVNSIDSSTQCVGATVRGPPKRGHLCRRACILGERSLYGCSSLSRGRPSSRRRCRHRFGISSVRGSRADSACPRTYNAIAGNRRCELRVSAERACGAVPETAASIECSASRWCKYFQVWAGAEQPRGGMLSTCSKLSRTRADVLSGGRASLLDKRGAPFLTPRTWAIAAGNQSGS